MQHKTYQNHHLFHQIEIQLSEMGGGYCKGKFVTSCNFRLVSVEGNYQLKCNNPPFPLHQSSSFPLNPQLYFVTLIQLKSIKQKKNIYIYIRKPSKRTSWIFPTDTLPNPMTHHAFLITVHYRRTVGCAPRWYRDNVPKKAFILQSIRLQLDLICLVQGFIAPTCHLQAVVSDP